MTKLDFVPDTNGVLLTSYALDDLRYVRCVMPLWTSLHERPKKGDSYEVN